MSTNHLQESWLSVSGDSHEFGVWAGLVSDPLTGVTLVRLSGELVFANDRAASIYLREGAEASAHIGKTMWDVFPGDWMRERVAIGRQVLESGKATMLRTLWNGHQVLTWIHPLDQDSGLPIEDRRLLLMTRRCVSADSSKLAAAKEPGFIESGVMRLGPLDVLTTRELEVLALVGQGMSIREIATALSRSEKTIQNHRDAIGAKLGVKNRVQVAQVAQQAGLRAEDANRVRV